MGEEGQKVNSLKNESLSILIAQGYINTSHTGDYQIDIQYRSSSETLDLTIYYITEEYKTYNKESLSL